MHIYETHPLASNGVTLQLQKKSVFLSSKLDMGLR